MAHLLGGKETGNTLPAPLKIKTGMEQKGFALAKMGSALSNWCENLLWRGFCREIVLAESFFPHGKRLLPVERALYQQPKKDRRVFHRCPVVQQ